MRRARIAASSHDIPVDRQPFCFLMLVSYIGVSYRSPDCPGRQSCFQVLCLIFVGEPSLAVAFMLFVSAVGFTEAGTGLQTPR